MTVYHTDCRHFRGDRPCRYRRLCDGCPHHSPVGLRILVIKLAAAGDVLRTTPILTALKRDDPSCHITWLTRPESAEMLSTLPEIDRLVALDVDALAWLPAERFDISICLDKEPAATGLASRIESPDKRGFVLGALGALEPATPDASYAYRLGLDDVLKFRGNPRSYQDIAFEAAGLVFRGEDYRLELPALARTRARDRWESASVGSDDAVIGLNVGAGDAFAYKAWRIEGWAELARRASDRFGARIALLGGARDRDRIEAVAKLAPGSVVDAGATPSILEFAALVERCGLIVTGDTLAMHLALALRRRVVVLFGSTSATEVALYGRGEKIVPAIDCHPCYKRECDFTSTCADAIGVDEVLEAMARVLGSDG